MASRPILLSSCARAATAGEAAYRIDAPIAPSRATRVISLDAGGLDIMRTVATMAWASARFLRCESATGAADGVSQVRTLTLEGAPTELADELEGVDVVVMLATSDAGAEAASVIGAACTVRGTMTAALVLGDGASQRAAVAALRPHARFILVTGDDDDVAEVLTALRT
jgi:hypothetical protein